MSLRFSKSIFYYHHVLFFKQAIYLVHITHCSRIGIDHTNSIDNPQNYTSVQQSATQTSRLLQALPHVLQRCDRVLIPSFPCLTPDECDIGANKVYGPNSNIVSKMAKAAIWGRAPPIIPGETSSLGRPTALLDPWHVGVLFAPFVNPFPTMDHQH